MNAQLLMSVAAFFGVLAAVYVVTAIGGRSAAVMRRRLDEHAVPVTAYEAKRLDRVKVLKEQNYSSIRVANVLLRRLKTAETASGDLMRSDVGLTVPQYLLARLIAGVLVAYAVRAVMGIPILAVPGFLIGLMLPRVILLILARRRRIAFEAQLAEAIDLLVGALRAGYGFLQAIESASREMASPMRDELGRVMDQVNVGATPTDALQELPRRIASYDLTLLVTAVTVQRTVGGNLAEVLENIAETVRERRRIRAEVRAITTGPRVSSYILGLFPFGLMLFFVTTNAGYRQVMLHETVGKLMLGFAAVWSLVGFVLSNAVSKVEY